MIVCVNRKRSKTSCRSSVLYSEERSLLWQSVPFEGSSFHLQAELSPVINIASLIVVWQPYSTLRLVCQCWLLRLIPIASTSYNSDWLQFHISVQKEYGNIIRLSMPRSYCIKYWTVFPKAIMQQTTSTYQYLQVVPTRGDVPQTQGELYAYRIWHHHCPWSHSCAIVVLNGQQSYHLQQTARSQHQINNVRLLKQVSARGIELKCKIRFRHSPIHIQDQS